jgi:ABC-type polysaccharide/polyol phosphate transport system ATPase subunit
MTDPAIVVTDVSKRFRLYHQRNQSIKAAVMRGGRAKYEEFWALRDVSFEVPRGSTFGIMGVNGSGKSTLLKCMARILHPDTGKIVSDGKLSALLELGSGFHQELSGRENVYLNGSILGLSKRELDSRFDDIVEFAGVEQFIDQPVKNYSSGMYVRLGFSVAINVDPDILLVDEVLAVGDAAFQEKCMEKFAEFRRAGKTVVVVSHAMGTMRTLCDEVAWLENGKLIEIGRPEELIDRYIDEGHEQREENTGGARWGSGEASLTSVSFLAADGRPTSKVRTGDAATIRVSYSLHERIEKPVFGLAVETLEGVYVWASNTRDADYVPDFLEGTGQLEFKIPRLMLLPGTFDISASIVDYSTAHVYDFRRHCYRFDVDHGTPRESGGVVSLGGSWGGLPETPDPTGTSGS